MAIPKKIHRVWFGGSMPDEFVEYERAWQRLNPAWQVRTWREDDLGWLTNRQAFDDAPFLSSKSNIARYEIVLREGGLYVDTDYEPLRPLDDLLDPSADLVLAAEEPDLLSNAFFGATAGHPVLADVVSGVAESHFAREGENSPQRTGPHYWTRTVRRSLAVHPESCVQTIPREAVTPYSWQQPHLRHHRFAEAWAVHHWAKSWVEPRGARRTAPVRRAVRGLSKRLKSGGASIVDRWHRMEPRARRPSGRPTAMYIGHRRMLATTSRGIPLIVDSGELTSLAGLVLDGEVDEAFTAFVERELRPGDHVVIVGDTAGAVSMHAAWTVGRMGRVFCYPGRPEIAEALAASVELNRARGLDAEVVIRGATIGTSGDDVGLDRELVGVPEIGLLRVVDPAIVPAVLATLGALVTERRIRLLDISLADVRAGAGWPAMTDCLRRIDRDHRPDVFTLAPDGRRRRLSIGAAINSDRVDHLVLDFE